MPDLGATVKCPDGKGQRPHDGGTPAPQDRSCIQDRMKGPANARITEHRVGGSTEQRTDPVDALFDRLDAMIAGTWAHVRASEFWRHVMADGFDGSLYRDLMVQVFHYTRFNSVNQALTILRGVPEERDFSASSTGTPTRNWDTR